MWINVTTIGDLVDQAAERSSSTALVVNGQRLSYTELASASTRFAASLAALGVRRGDRVGVLMHNSVDYALALIASAKLGAIAVPVNGRFRAHEASYVIGHAEVTALVTSTEPEGVDFPALVEQIVANDQVLEGVSIVDLSSTPRTGFIGRAEFERLADHVDEGYVRQEQAKVRVRDVAVLMYTSGTTAKPKGCLLTHEALVRQGEKVARTRFELTANDAIWDPLPMFHCGGIVPMLGAFSTGAKFVHPGRFEATSSLAAIESERCTVLYPAFEAIWLPLVTHPNFSADKLQHVRLVQNIATPERMEQFETQMPWAKHVTSYGSTECATNLTMGLASDPPDLRLRTLGPPVEGIEVKIVDPETGNQVPPGVMGELCFRGYSCFEGYYKEPELTAAAFDADGYFHTGDRACIEKTGHLRYGGRLKDMIKVGGENVAAIEIEDYLATHPCVRIAQVVSVPDARYDEVPAAFIELQEDTSLTEQEVINYCIGQIASYKVPRYVRFVTDWPMSGTKVKKFELQRPLVAELTASGIPEAPKVRVPSSSTAKSRTSGRHPHTGLSASIV
ncbi:class I adenylate-forming enzyme family protein [Rhodococcus koreensis]